MQKLLVFDIETNGLLDTVTKIHCLVIYNTETKEYYRYSPKHIKAGVIQLMNCLNAGGSICGHNIINYDIPVLSMFFPQFRITREQRKHVIDTLVLARLVFSEIKYIDNKLCRLKVLPASLYGRHSLKAYGYRLGILKGTYGEGEGDVWEAYSEEMLDYCQQDVAVTTTLYNKSMHKLKSEDSLQTELAAQWLMEKLHQNGFPFDVSAAREMYTRLQKEQTELQKEFKNFPPMPDKVFIPKRNNKAKGYVAGVPIQRYKPFNPSSRVQIRQLFEKVLHYKFEDPEMWKEDKDGRLKLHLDETTFELVSQDPKASPDIQRYAKVFSRSFFLQKQLGMLNDGKYGWLKCVEADGCIHGSVNPNGAITARATHSKPNLAQIPAHTEFGGECRSLFTVPKGWSQVGIDACGLELRCLAHYLAEFDGGEYGEECVHGDIHTKNMIAAGLHNRDQAKTMIYGYLYGAGDEKIGKIVGGTAEDGHRIKQTFLKATPALKKLQTYVKNTLSNYNVMEGRREWKTRYLTALDGRLLYVRSVHSALNTLLQSCGAIICKKWIILTEEALVQKGFRHGWDGDFALMAWVHDEQQIAARTPEIAEVVKETAEECMHKVQKYYHVQCQLDAEGKIGKNWRDCH